MEFKTKFNTRDEVFIISYEHPVGICEVCSGIGSLDLVGGKVIPCPSCKEGWVEDRTKYKAVVVQDPCIITGGTIYFDAEGKISSIDYELDEGGEFNEEDIYLTREEAQAYCDEANSKGK